MSTHVTFVPGAAGLASFWQPVADRLPAGWTRTFAVATRLTALVPTAAGMSIDTDHHWVARAFPAETAVAIIGLGATGATR